MNRKLQRFLLHRIFRYAIAPGLLVFGGVPGELWTKVSLLAAGWAGVAGSNIAADLRRKGDDARHALTYLLQTIVTSFEAARPSSTGRTLRANIMLIDKKRDVLVMTFHTAGYGETEKNLVWARGQGCVGRAWESAQTRVAPEDFEMPLRPEDAALASRPYGMTEEQIQLTAGRIGSVICVPIFLPRKPSEVAALLSLDDSKGLDDSLLGDPDIRGAVEELAAKAGELLESVPEDGSPT